MFCNIDINTVISVLSLVVSFISLIVMIGIFNTWEAQKRKEVVANDANLLINKIISLREKIHYINTYSPKLRNDIEYVIEAQKILDFQLGTLKEIYINLEYKEYTNTIGDIISDWNNYKDTTNNLTKNNKARDKLLDQLKDLKLYNYNFKKQAKSA